MPTAPDSAPGASQTPQAPAPAAAQSPRRAQEGQIVVNPQTGERLQLRGGQWQRIQ